MQSIAIIPARGGSKRLPRKNIMPFLEKPMLLWTCEAAQKSGRFQRIIVSTDSDEIAQVAQDAGFECDHRPEYLGTDTASTAQVCLELLERLECSDDIFDSLCCLYATAPLRNAADIQAVMALLDDELTRFAFAVCEYEHHPWQALIENNEGFLVPVHPGLVSRQSQTMPRHFIGNGSTYAARVIDFRREQSFYGPSLKGYVMPPWRSVDIDTYNDFERALYFANIFSKKNNA